MDINKSIAREIQARLSPQTAFDIPAYEYCGACRSADEVGGDGYDVLEMSDARIAFVVADVSGKGLLGSLRMAMTLGELRTRVAEGKAPSLCLAETNAAIFPDVKGRRFVSLVFGALDVHSHCLTLVDAGHNPTYLVRESEVLELKPRGIALGAVPQEKFHARELTQELLPGEIILFYSDGITEARNKNLDEYGEARLKKYLLKNREGNLENIRDGLFMEISQFVRGAEQHDDMTLLLLRRRVEVKTHKKGAAVMGFSVNVKSDTWKDKVRIFSLEGQLDSKTIQELEAVIKREKIKEDNSVWVMDLSKLSYVSSAGVAIFIGLGYEAEGKEGLCFYGASEKVHSVFDLLGLTDVFRFYSSEEDAKSESGL